MVNPVKDAGVSMSREAEARAAAEKMAGSLSKSDAEKLVDHLWYRGARPIKQWPHQLNRTYFGPLCIEELSQLIQEGISALRDA